MELEGMGEKSADNLLEAIEKSKTRPLARLIFALGIRHVGAEMAGVLAQKFNDLDALALATREWLKAKATREKLKAKATREKLKAKATREKLKAKDTREKLKALATREKLKAKDTREKLKALATGEKLRAKDAREKLKALATGEKLRAKDTREKLKALATGEKLRALAAKEKLKALAAKENLMSIDTVGPKIAESIAAFLEQKENKRIIQRLKDAGVNLKAEKAKPEGLPLSGMEFVITGRLEAFSRQEAEARVKALGGTAKDNVTRNTTYLVVGEEPGTSKLNQADRLNTERLTEAAFVRKIGERQQTFWASSEGGKLI
jgi:NAD-dependent DNA ligase